MRKLIPIAALTAFAAPAFADTLTEVTTKGMVLSVMGMDLDIAYNPDGTWVVNNDELTAMLGEPLTGKWRIDGDTLCTTSTVQPAEDCVVYPAGKTSGDTFEVQGAQGPGTVTIK